MPEYTVTPARYAKNMMAVHCPSDGSGWKTRAHYLCCALRGRYSGRENAYILSPTKARRFEHLYRQGWNASPFGTLIPPKGEGAP